MTPCENFDSESYAEFIIRFYDTSLPASVRHEQAGSRIVLNLKEKKEKIICCRWT